MAVAMSGGQLTLKRAAASRPSGELRPDCGYHPLGAVRSASIQPGLIGTLEVIIARAESSKRDGTGRPIKRRYDDVI